MTDERGSDPQALRRRILFAISSESIETRARWSEALCKMLIEEELPILRVPSRLVLYRSLPTEPDPSLFAEAAIRAGHFLFYPRVEGAALAFLRVEDPCAHAWKKGSFGTEEPSGGDSVSAADLDWILVPGLGFTPSGHRLGRGKGFYDRLLSKIPPKTRTVAIAYPPSRFQVLPQHEGDRAVSKVWFL